MLEPQEQGCRSGPARDHGAKHVSSDSLVLGKCQCVVSRCSLHMLMAQRISSTIFSINWSCVSLHLLAFATSLRHGWLIAACHVVTRLLCLGGQTGVPLQRLEPAAPLLQVTDCGASTVLRCTVPGGDPGALRADVFIPKAGNRQSPEVDFTRTGAFSRADLGTVAGVMRAANNIVQHHDGVSSIQVSDWKAIMQRQGDRMCLAQGPTKQGW